QSTVNVELNGASQDGQRRSIRPPHCGHSSGTSPSKSSNQRRAAPHARQKATQSPSTLRRSSRSHSEALPTFRLYRRNQQAGLSVLGRVLGQVTPARGGGTASRRERYYPSRWRAEKKGGSWGKHGSPHDDLAVLQSVQTDGERDAEPSIDGSLVVSGEIEHIAVAQLELPVHMADHPAVHQEIEVVGDREPLAVGHEVDDAARDRHREAALLGGHDLAAVGVRHLPRRAEQGFAEGVLQYPDRSTLRRRDVVARAADVEHRAGLDPEDLLRLVLVGVEADVLLDRHALLPDVGDRAAGRRLARGQRRDAIQIDHRPYELVDQEAVVCEALIHWGRW